MKKAFLPYLSGLYILCSLFGCKNIQPNEGKTENICFLDYDKDGKHELLVVHTSKSIDSSIIDLIDPKTRAIIWSTYCGKNVKNIKEIEDCSFVVLSEKPQDSALIEKFNNIDGKKLFSHTYNPAYAHATFSGAIAFVNYEFLKPRNRNEAIQYEDENYSISNYTDYVDILDLNTRYFKRIYKDFLFKISSFIIKNRRLYYFRKDTLFERRFTNDSMLFSKKKVIATQINRHSEYIAIYKNSIIYNTKKTVSGICGIGSYNVANKKNNYVYYYPKGCSGELIGTKSISMQTRFIPIFVSNEKKHETYLIIFDFEVGKPIWESKKSLAGNHYKSIKVLYHNKYYNIQIIPEQQSDSQVIVNPVVMSFNGHTGKFYKSKIIFSEHFNCFNNNKFCGNYFACNDKIALCLSFPELETAYTNDKDLTVSDAKMKIEKVFGKMPWQN